MNYADCGKGRVCIFADVQLHSNVDAVIRAWLGLTRDMEMFYLVFFLEPILLFTARIVHAVKAVSFLFIFLHNNVVYRNRSA